MMTDTNLLQGDALDKAIASIKNRGAKLDDDIQHTALSCLNQAIEHGNVTPLNQLYKAMPKGARLAALSAWAMEYAPVTGNDAKLKAVRDEKPFVYDKAGPRNLEAAIAKPWYNFKKDKEPSEVFNFKEQLARLLKRAESASKRGQSLEGSELYEQAAKLLA